MTTKISSLSPEEVIPETPPTALAQADEALSLHNAETPTDPGGRAQCPVASAALSEKAPFGEGPENVIKPGGFHEAAFGFKLPHKEAQAYAVLLLEKLRAAPSNCHKNPQALSEIPEQLRRFSPFGFRDIEVTAGGHSNLIIETTSEIPAVCYLIMHLLTRFDPMGFVQFLAEGDTTLAVHVTAQRTHILNPKYWLLDRAHEVPVKVNRTLYIPSSTEALDDQSLLLNDTSTPGPQVESAQRPLPSPAQCGERTSEEDPKNRYVVIMLDEAINAPFTMTVVAADEEKAELAAVAYCKCQDKFEGEGDNGYRALLAFDSADLKRMATDLSAVEANAAQATGLSGSNSSLPLDFAI